MIFSPKNDHSNKLRMNTDKTMAKIMSTLHIGMPTVTYSSLATTFSSQDKTPHLLRIIAANLHDTVLAFFKQTTLFTNKELHSQ